MNRLKLNSLSRNGIPSRAIIFSAIVVAFQPLSMSCQVSRMPLP